MSNSVEAHLKFGFRLNLDAMDSDLQSLLKGPNAFKVYAAKKGLIEPPKTPGVDWEQVLTFQRDLRSLIGDLKLDLLGSELYNDEDGLNLYLSAKTYSAYMGCVAELDAKALWVRRDLILKLKDFCDTLGIPWQKPKWYLVCERD